MNRPNFSLMQTVVAARSDIINSVLTGLKISGGTGSKEAGLPHTLFWLVRNSLYLEYLFYPRKSGASRPFLLPIIQTVLKAHAGFRSRIILRKAGKRSSQSAA